MLCQKCGKRHANFHYTQVVNNTKTEFNLCSECASEMGLTKSTSLSFDSILNSFFTPSLRSPRLFKIDGERLYKNEFEQEIDKMFSGFGDEIKNTKTTDGKENLDTLKSSLDEAVKQERFEDAAKIRDRIKQLEEKE